MKQSEASRQIRNMYLRLKTMPKTQPLDARVQQLTKLVSDLVDLVATGYASKACECR